MTFRSRVSWLIGEPGLSTAEPDLAGVGSDRSDHADDDRRAASATRDWIASVRPAGAEQHHGSGRRIVAGVKSPGRLGPTSGNPVDDTSIPVTSLPRAHRHDDRIAGECRRGEAANLRSVGEIANETRRSAPGHSWS
jgi:hypothetical protein